MRAWILPLVTLATWAVLHAVHASWDSGLPILGWLSPVIAVASTVASRFEASFRLVALLGLAIGSVLFLATAASERRMPVPVLLLLIALAGQLALRAGDVALYYTFLGIVFGLVVLRQFREPKTADRSGSEPAHLWVWCVVILLAAFVFRFYALDSNPPGINDEAAGNAVLLKHYVDGGDSVVLAHFTSDRPLGESWLGNVCSVLSVFFFRIFGFDPLSLRLLSATTGVLTVFASFCLGRKLFGAGPALWAAFFLAVSAWHSFFSRTDYSLYSLVPLHAVLTYQALFAAFEYRTYRQFALLGVLLGLSVFLYEPGKATLLSGGLTALILLVQRLRSDSANRRLYARLCLVFLVAFGITIIPYIRSGLNDSAYLYSLAGRNSPNKAFWNNPEAPGLGRYVLENAKWLAPMLTHSSVSPPNAFTTCHYCPPDSGLLNPAISLFVVVGIALTVGNRFRGNHLLLLLWTLIGVLPALLVAVLPRRLLAATVPIYLWAGVGADWLLTPLLQARRDGVRRHLVLSSACVGVALIVSYEATQLFVKKQYGAGDALHPAYFQNRRALRAAAKESDFYAIGDWNSILEFVLGSGRPPVRPVQNSEAAVLSILRSRRGSGRDVTFFMPASDRRNFPWLQQLTTHPTVIESEDFTMVRLRGEDLEGIFDFAAPHLPP